MWGPPPAVPYLQQGYNSFPPATQPGFGSWQANPDGQKTSFVQSGEDQASLARIPASGSISAPQELPPAYAKFLREQQQQQQHSQMFSQQSTQLSDAFAKPGPGSSAMHLSMSNGSASQTAYDASFMNAFTGPEVSANSLGSWSNILQSGLSSMLSRGSKGELYGRDEYLMRLLGSGRPPLPPNVSKPTPVAPIPQRLTSSQPEPNIGQALSASLHRHEPSSDNGRTNNLAGPNQGFHAAQNSQNPGQASQRAPSQQSNEPKHGDVHKASDRKEQGTASLTGAQSIRQALGEPTFNRVRSVILSQQETFMHQIFELHRVVAVQRHLVAVCDRPDVLKKEIQRLEYEAQQQSLLKQQQKLAAEQQYAWEMYCRGLQASQARPPFNPLVPPPPFPQGLLPPPGAKPQQQDTSGNTYSQATPLPFNTASRQLTPQQQPSLSEQAPESVATPVMQPQPPLMPQAPPMPQPVMPPPQALPLMFPNLPPYPPVLAPPAGPRPTLQQQLQAGFDPLTAWYAQYYGRNQAGPHLGPPQPHPQPPIVPSGPSGGANPSQPPPHHHHQQQQEEEPRRWWQDPEQVFGPACVPGMVTVHAEAARQALMAAGGGEVNSKQVEKLISGRHGNDSPPAAPSTATRALSHKDVPIKKRRLPQAFSAQHQPQEPVLALPHQFGSGLPDRGASAPSQLMVGGRGTSKGSGKKAKEGGGKRKAGKGPAATEASPNMSRVCAVPNKPAKVRKQRAPTSPGLAHAESVGSENTKSTPPNREVNSATTQQPTLQQQPAVQPQHPPEEKAAGILLSLGHQSS